MIRSLSPNILLVCILILALTLRLFYSQTRSFFFHCDELISASAVMGIPLYGKMPVKEKFTTEELRNRSLSERLIQCAKSGDNGNSYLFNMVLSFWIDVFGISDLSFRFFSILCDCLSVMVLFFIGKNLRIGAGKVLLACLMMSIGATFFMFTGGFVRTYSFTLLMSLLSTLYFLKAYNDPQTTKYYIVMILAFLAAFFGHFLTYYVFAVLFVFSFLKRKDNPVFFKRAFISMVVFAVIAGALLMLNKSGIADMQARNANLKTAVQASGEAAGKVFSAKGISLAVTHYVVSFYTSVFSMVGFAHGMGLTMLPFWFFFIMFLFPVLLFIWQYKRIKEGNYLLPWLFVIAANVSALGMMLLNKHFTSLDPRYSIFSVPFFFLLMAQVDLRSGLKQIFLGSYIVVLIISTAGTFNRYNTKEINLKIAEVQQTFFNKDLAKVKSYFASKLTQLNKDDLICFNNVNEFIFFTLITNGKVTNPCIIDSTYPNGMSSESLRIDYIYYGDC